MTEMSPDEQEARSRRLSNDVIMLLPLSSGRVAVFNRGGDLCAIENPLVWKQHGQGEYSFLEIELLLKWRPPASRSARPNPTLEELFK